MSNEEIKEYNRIRMGNVLDEYTPDTLPTYEDCRTLLFNEQYRKKNGDYKPEGDGILDRNPTELERYVYEETPKNKTAEIYFRERLADLLNWHRTAIAEHLPILREQAEKIAGDAWDAALDWDRNVGEWDDSSPDKETYLKQFE
jgi:hypothetical protein